MYVFISMKEFCLVIALSATLLRVSSYYIAEVERVKVGELADDGLTTLGGVFTAYQGIEQIQTEHYVGLYGNADLVDPARTLVRNAHETPDFLPVTLVAVAGQTPAGSVSALPLISVDTELAANDVLGFALPALPLREDREVLLGTSITVRSDVRRQGIGSRLYEALEQLARQHGRTTLNAISDSREGTGPDAIRPRLGQFAITPDKGATFALKHGYTLVEAARHSVQTLTPNVLQTAKQWAHTPAGYDFFTFEGPTPDHLLRANAVLVSAMSTDAPAGDFKMEAQVWDEARVRDSEDTIFRSKKRVMTLAVHRESGEPAGYTALATQDVKPQVVDQWDTLVHANHRGHGLGLAMKAVNLLAAVKAWPQARRVHTWNAAENDHMWAINEKLGYQVVSIDSGWQKKLTN